MVRIENVHWHHYSRGYLSRELRGFLHILRSYVINNNNSKNKPFYCSKFDCGGSFNWRLSWSLNCQQFFTCSRDMIDRSVLFHSWNQEQKRAEKPCFLINFNHDKYMYILYIYIYIYTEENSPKFLKTTQKYSHKIHHSKLFRVVKIKLKVSHKYRIRLSLLIKNQLQS